MTEHSLWCIIIKVRGRIQKATTRLIKISFVRLSTYFKYPPEIRKIIYTPNAIENFNRQLRKVTKSKTIFPTDDALFKILYLAMCDITEKWTGAGWNWGQTLDQLCIYFDGRITPADID